MKKLSPLAIAAIADKIKSNQFVMQSPAQLKPSPHNAKKHPRGQKVKLRASIEAFGFTAPVLVDEDNVIIAGHCRKEVAEEMGLESVPTIILKGLGDVQKRALMLADNRIAELASWDQDQLILELNFLVENDFSVDLSGFSTGEHDILLEGSQVNAKKSDPDDLKEEDCKGPAVTLPGDLWVFDERHRLLCGSALDPAAYETLMQGDMAQMVISDPPYNEKVSNISGSGKIKHAEFAMASGEMSSAAFTTFLNSAFTLMHEHSEKNATAFYFMDWRHQREILDAAELVYGKLRQLCVWCKSNGGMGTFYRSQHELVFVFRKGDGPGINNFELGQNGRYRTNVWNYPGINTFKNKGHELLKLHPTVKPIALIADALRDCSHRKGLVLDAFAGSGTIILAAERTGRRARAIELEPKYVDTAIARWTRTVGKPVILYQTGQTYEEVMAERLSSRSYRGGAA